MNFKNPNKIIPALLISIFCAIPVTAHAAVTSRVYYTIDSNVAVGQDFNIYVNADNLTDLYGQQLNLTFDPTLFQVDSVQAGSFYSGKVEGIDYKLVTPATPTLGLVSEAIVLLGSKYQAGLTVPANSQLFVIKAHSLKTGTIALKTVTDNSALTATGNNACIKLSNSNSTQITGVTYETATASINTRTYLPLTAGKYEQDNANLQYVGTWTKDTNANYNSGTATVANTTGSSVTFKFTGTGFNWTGLKGPNFGNAKITIDGTVYTANNYASVATKTVLFQKTGLTSGDHTVKIEVTNTKATASTNYYQLIDSIEIVNTPVSTTLTAGKYEQDNANLQYVGTWIKDTNANYNSGTATVSNTSGSSVTFKFTGTGFNWTGLKGPNFGNAKIIVDGTVYTANNYASTATKTVLFQKTGLTSGDHTVKIEVTNTKATASTNYYQLIDSIEIVNIPVSTTLTAGKYEQDNANLQYVGTWFKDTNTNYNSGTATVSNTSGSSVTFKFTGTGFNWTGLKGPNFGNAKITVDGTVYTANNYASTATKTVLFQKTGLTSGDHTVKIEVTNTKQTASTNYYQLIDSIEIVNIPVSTTLTAGKYEQDNANLQYVGAWIKDTNANYNSGTAILSNTSGSSVTFKFTGTGFNWTGIKGPTIGNAKITIDGTVYTASNYSSTPIKTVLFQKTGLTSGDHTVKIEVTNTKEPASTNYYQLIDSIEIVNIPVSTTLTAGKYEQDNANLQYVGAWAKDTNTGYNSGTALVSNTSGSSVTFKFTGTEFSWTGLKGPNIGNAKITVDGTVFTAINYASAAIKTVLFQKTGLTSGIHTVKIEVTKVKEAASTNYYQVIDSIEVK